MRRAVMHEDTLQRDANRFFGFTAKIDDPCCSDDDKGATTQHFAKEHFEFE